MIGYYYLPTHEHPVPLQNLLDQEASADCAAETGRACLVLIIEAPHELGPATLVIGLHKHRPAALICCEQSGALLLKGSRQLVKDGVWTHIRIMAQPTDPAVDYFNSFRHIQESQLIAWISV